MAALAAPSSFAYAAGSGLPPQKEPMFGSFHICQLRMLG
jgi:hypothetical protein